MRMASSAMNVSYSVLVYSFWEWMVGLGGGWSETFGNIDSMYEVEQLGTVMIRASGL